MDKSVFPYILSRLCYHCVDIREANFKSCIWALGLGSTTKQTALMCNMHQYKCATRAPTIDISFKGLRIDEKKCTAKRKRCINCFIISQIIEIHKYFCTNTTLNWLALLTTQDSEVTIYKLIASSLLSPGVRVQIRCRLRCYWRRWRTLPYTVIHLESLTREGERTRMFSTPDYHKACL